jgi:hypothetical protein
VKLDLTRSGRRTGWLAVVLSAMAAVALVLTTGWPVGDTSGASTVHAASRSELPAAQQHSVLAASAGGSEWLAGRRSVASLNRAAGASGDGYWLVGADGSVFNFGTANFGGLTGKPLYRPIVAMAETPDGGGYWLVASDGGVFAFGDAQYLGSMGGKPLNQPVVGMAATADGNGYWLVAADGGIFSFGDAQFYGSMGARHLDKPVVGMAATGDGQGYWLVASDGGIFAFGDASFHGSMGGKPLVEPMVGIAPTADGNGYWTDASDGGIFAFGDASFHGSKGGAPLAQPMSGMAATPDGNGYWTVAHDGGLFAFGDAPYWGSEGGHPLAAQVVGMAVATSGYPYPVRSSGNDVSYPQCSPTDVGTSAGTLPGGQAFAVVGVNGGLMQNFNPCFGPEAAWAGQSLSVYIDANAPTSGNPAQAMTGPDAACAATSGACQAYDWGYNLAQADVAFVHGQGLHPQVWWVDVETAESWSASATDNAAVVQGALDALTANGLVGGIYCTWYQWGEITGSYVPPGNPPLWIPGADNVTGDNFSATSICARALTPGDPTNPNSVNVGFAGGVPWLVQYGYSGYSGPASAFDLDFACGPSASAPSSSAPSTTTPSTPTTVGTTTTSTSTTTVLSGTTTSSSTSSTTF